MRLSINRQFYANKYVPFGILWSAWVFVKPGESGNRGKGIAKLVGFSCFVRFGYNRY